MKHFIPSLLVLASVVAVTQEPPKPRVSADFAKAANLSLVTIKNGSAPRLQEEAINAAEAAALSPEETHVVAVIKTLASLRNAQVQIAVLGSTRQESSGAFDRSRDNKAREGWCRSVGFDSVKGGQTPCGLAWQDHKEEGVSGRGTACVAKFSRDLCREDAQPKPVGIPRSDLEKTDACIAAWRISLRNLSSEQPQECEGYDR